MTALLTVLKALTVDRTDFRPLTVIIYRRMHSDSNPSLVYGLTERSHSCDCGAYWSDLPLGGVDEGREERGRRKSEGREGGREEKEEAFRHVGWWYIDNSP